MKHAYKPNNSWNNQQPPLGGCVLKQRARIDRRRNHGSAAFRRLCVETCVLLHHQGRAAQPPLGGCMLKQRTNRRQEFRLFQPPLGGCVLKHRLSRRTAHIWIHPPSGGCVLKRFEPTTRRRCPSSSHLRVAVC